MKQLWFALFILLATVVSAYAQGGPSTVQQNAFSYTTTGTTFANLNIQCGSGTQAPIPPNCANQTAGTIVYCKDCGTGVNGACVGGGTGGLYAKRLLGAWKCADVSITGGADITNYTGPVNITGNNKNGGDQVGGMSVNGWQNIMAWGADPTGATDSTAAINAATNAARIDANGNEYYGTLYCPSLYWGATGWTPAHYKVNGTINVWGFENVECADATFDWTGLTTQVAWWLGASPSTTYVGQWHPSTAYLGNNVGPGPTSKTIGVLMGNCAGTGLGPGTGFPYFNKECTTARYGQWMKSSLLGGQLSNFGTDVAVGGNTYDTKIRGVSFWQSGIGYDESYMWQGSASGGFTNGGTDMVLSDNIFTSNNLAVLLCASNEISMMDNAFEDNVSPYVQISFCNGAGPVTIRIKSRFENSCIAAGQVSTPAGQPEYINITGAPNQLDLGGSNFVDTGCATPPAGFPVCFNTNTDMSGGHVSFDNSYVGELANYTTRSVFGLCTGNTDTTRVPSVSFMHVRPELAMLPDRTKIRLLNPSLNISGFLSGGAPAFSVASQYVNGGTIGYVTQLTCINTTGGSCTTAPTVDVAAASNSGTALACSNTFQGWGSFNTTPQNLFFSPGSNVGVYSTVAGTSCSANFMVSATILETN
jgi:hypothetical protein